MNDLTLSAKGQELIELYKHMAAHGYERSDGSKIINAYSDFELKKFRNICKGEFLKHNIETVLDYGGGGSDWNEADFDPVSGKSARDYFGVRKVTTFEPARNLMKKKISDSVVCFDVLEHIFVSDVPNVIEELFSLTKKLLIINVACYKASALLPNGENAHITVRSADWWKGVVDAIATRFEGVKVMLICSETYASGLVFETFSSSDWLLSDSFVAETNPLIFKLQAHS